MKEEIGGRLRAVMDKCHLKSTLFSEKIGKSRTVVGSYISGRCYPPFEFLIALKQEIPTLNMDWLISGEGEMLHDELEESGAGVKLLQQRIKDLESREREMTNALMNLSRAIGKGESAKFETVCEKTGVSMEKVNGRWSFTPKHTHEHTVRFAC